MKRAIATGGAPAPVGPYSQAIDAAGLVFCAGQIGLDPATGELVAGGIGPETARVLENLRAVLGAAGLGPADVVKVTVYMADLAEWGAMNAVYERVFAAPHPARAAVAVAALPRGARVEIDAIAVRAASA